MLKPKYLFILFIFVACASNNSRQKVKSPLNHLNGENYTTSPQGSSWIGPVPIGVSKKDKLSLISGTMLAKNGIMFSPINHEKLILIKKNTKKRYESTSQAGGQFQFSGHFENGIYEIIVNSQKYKGKLKFEVKSYETTNLRLIVTLKNSKTLK